MTWVIGSSKTIGKSHLATGTVCQDSADFRLTDAGERFVLALSDGAGSSKNSEVGSGLFTKRVCSTLAEALNRFSAISDKELDQVVIEIIQALRDELKQLGDLNDFHATSLIAVGSNQKVRIFHIGDGSALIGERISKDKFLLHRSEPENGEFSNETFFFTLDQWQDKLRIFSVANPAFCILCSDGVDPFIWDPSAGTRQGFIKPILKKILEDGDSSQASDTLKNVIEDPRTDSVTNDDKSVIVAIAKSIDPSRSEKWNFSDKNKPIVKSYEEINKELASALQTKNIELTNSLPKKTKVLANEQAQEPKSSSLKSVFIAFIFLGFLATIIFAGYLFFSNLLNLPVIFQERINQARGQIEGAIKNDKDQLNVIKSRIEDVVDKGGSQPNITNNEEQIVRIVEIPAASSTPNKVKKKDVSKPLPAEKKSSSSQAVDSELPPLPDTSSKKALDD